jgi:hypothetical protein
VKIRTNKASKKNIKFPKTKNKGMKRRKNIIQICTVGFEPVRENKKKL